MSQYIVLEISSDPQSISIVTDENGKNKVFDSYAEAAEEAGQCQDGLTVQIR